jgi:hypothetical protein
MFSYALCMVYFIGTELVLYEFIFFAKLYNEPDNKIIKK